MVKVSFNAEYDKGIDPSIVYDAVPNGGRDAASDLYLEGELKYVDVPNELLAVEEETAEPAPHIVNQVVKIGRNFIVRTGAVKQHKGRDVPVVVTICKGSVLLKLAARPVYPHYLVKADDSIPPFWIGKSNEDLHYQSNETREVIIK
jgi:hypothetical protein